MGSISSKTSFILAGDNMGPSKLQKAEKLGVAIVSEDEFLQMIAGGDTESADDSGQAPSEEKEKSVKVEDKKENKGPIQLELF